MKKPKWTPVLIDLLSLASRLESEGQYNLARLARAAALNLSHWHVRHGLNQLAGILILWCLDDPVG